MQSSGEVSTDLAIRGVVLGTGEDFAPLELDWGGYAQSAIKPDACKNENFDGVAKTSFR